MTNKILARIELKWGQIFLVLSLSSFKLSLLNPATGSQVQVTIDEAAHILSYGRSPYEANKV